VYTPAETSQATPAEAAVCKAWTLDAGAATEFFQLSKPLREGELHNYDWLPCSIKGRVQAEGKLWDFEINAAGTSTWRSTNETRLLGCAKAACEPFVMLMPQGQES
jgi:hypothetical protein